jgi:UDP-2,4-diacetamido-2,4,6-trideoxy-beta-L-altropyranose hydrolase
MSALVVGFRTHAGRNIGLGHLRRCLTLARAVEGLGGKSHFIVNRDPSVSSYLKRQGVTWVEVDEEDGHDLSKTSRFLANRQTSVCVIDSYEIPGESMTSLQGVRVVVLDDLADRYLDVDIVVNGTPGAKTLPYRTGPRTRMFLGPKYLILREEFSDVPPPVVKAQIERVLIMLGGTDQQALTPRVVPWVREVLPKAMLDVVIGPFFGLNVIREIEALAGADSKVATWLDPPPVHKLMASADLAVIGGGQTAYELAASGIPAVAIRLVENQTGNLRGLALSGALQWVGDADDVDLKGKLQAAVDTLARDLSARESMSHAGRALVDGLGAARVARALSEDL